MSGSAGGLAGEGRPSYRVAQAVGPVRLAAGWDAPEWARIEPLRVGAFRPESSDHRPVVEARMQHDGRGLFGLFRVQDRYVRAVATKLHDMVCQDSCVEFFVRPKADRGYVNFEFSAGGAMLGMYITNWERVPGGFREFVWLSPEDAGRVDIRPSLPGVTDPERPGPLTWELGFHVPVALLEKYVGPVGGLSGQRWRANFFKCADKTSHPHWAAWSAVDRLNFHLPPCFGELSFE